MVRENLATFHAAIEDSGRNPHLHVVALDGLKIAGPDGQTVFRALGRPKTDVVADVVQVAKIRVLEALARRGVVRVSAEALEVDDTLAAQDPVLAQLAVVAVAALPPAGPAERKREPVVLAARGGPEIAGDLVVQACGSNLHAKTRAGAVDNEDRSRLADRDVSGDKKVSLASRETVTVLVREAFPGTEVRSTRLFDIDGPNYALVFDIRASAAT